MKQALEHKIALKRRAYVPLSQKAISFHNLLNTPINIRPCEFKGRKSCHGKFIHKREKINLVPYPFLHNVVWPSVKKERVAIPSFVKIMDGVSR